MAKVLVVDDSIAMRKNIRVFLKDLGHEVVAEASNGREAFHEYKRCLPDLVTMDISMPTMDGIASVRLILESFPDANIIMITALGQRSAVYEALKSGARGYIVKPIESGKLKEVIENVLSSQGRENRSINGECERTSTVKPFSIENQAGRFIVKINERIDNISFEFLNDALQGIMFIKPLDITFDFGDSKNIDEEILGRISRIVKGINDSGEKAAIACKYGII